MYVFISKGEQKGDERKYMRNIRLVLTFITGILQMDPAALNGVYATTTTKKTDFREQTCIYED